jgi:hypothetical protein
VQYADHEDDEDKPVKRPETNDDNDKGIGDDAKEVYEMREEKVDDGGSDDRDEECEGDKEKLGSIKEDAPQIVSVPLKGSLAIEELSKVMLSQCGGAVQAGVEGELLLDLRIEYVEEVIIPSYGLPHCPNAQHQQQNHCNDVGELGNHDRVGIFQEKTQILDHGSNDGEGEGTPVAVEPTEAEDKWCIPLSTSNFASL